MSLPNKTRKIFTATLWFPYTPGFTSSKPSDARALSGTPILSAIANELGNHPRRLVNVTIVSVFSTLSRGDGLSPCRGVQGMRRGGEMSAHAIEEFEAQAGIFGT